MSVTKKKTAPVPREIREVTVENKLGIHARPASMFVRLANQYDCNVYVEKDGERVNGKSIMGLMMLAAGPGCKITIFVEGKDATIAAEKLVELIKSKFDEE